MEGDRPTCEADGCDVPVPNRTGAPRRFCSQACSREAHRRQPRGGDLGQIGSALVELLRDSRRVGLDFESAWSEDIQTAVAFIKDEERRCEWITALSRAEPVFRAAWQRAITI